MKIKSIRMSNKMTQLDLSKKLEVSRSTIANWESGISCPSVAQLPELAAALNCSIDDLFEKEEVAAND